MCTQIRDSHLHQGDGSEHPTESNLLAAAQPPSTDFHAAQAEASLHSVDTRNVLRRLLATAAWDVTMMPKQPAGVDTQNIMLLKLGVKSMCRSRISVLMSPATFRRLKRSNSYTA